MIKTICETCGKEFYKKPWNLRHTRHNYCCYKCFTVSCYKQNIFYDGDGFLYMEISSPKHGVFKVKIDYEDKEKVNNYKWVVSIHKGGVFYIMARDKATGRNVQLHRLITGCPSNLTVDHINHDTLDNRKENLKVCTHSENNLNKGLHPYNKTGYKNICRGKRKPFRVAVTRNRKQLCSKEFNSLSEAIEYRDNFLKEITRDE